jgi:hypothetical protein
VRGRAVAGVGADGDLGSTPGRRAARRRVPGPGGAAPGCPYVQHVRDARFEAPPGAALPLAGEVRSDTSERNEAHL